MDYKETVMFGMLKGRVSQVSDEFLKNCYRELRKELKIRGILKPRPKKDEDK
jgi:hypothetical protein